MIFSSELPWFEPLSSFAVSSAGGCGVVGIIGSALDIIIDLLSFLSCDDRPECAPVDEWSAWAGGGAAIYGDMQGLFKKVDRAFPTASAGLEMA